MWRCACDCGGETVVMSTNMFRTDGKSTKSCGCLHREVTATDTPYLCDFKVAPLQGFRTSQKKKPYPWSLTFEQYREIVTKPCHYCGAPPSQKTKNVGHLKNGIDRVDSSVGYHFANCVPCCARCNVMKGAASVVDFLAHVARIHEFSVKKVPPNV